MSERTNEIPEEIKEEIAEIKEEIREEIAELKEEVKETIEEIKEEIREVFEDESEIYDDRLIYDDPTAKSVEMNAQFGKVLDDEEEIAVWGKKLCSILDQVGIDPGDERLRGCIVFQRNGRCFSFNPVNPKPDAEEIGRMALHYLEFGGEVCLFRPGEAAPISITYDEKGYPAGYTEQKEMEAKPEEPQKLSRWVRFAHWITRGKAYREEYNAYEQSVADYRNNLEAWERESGDNALGLYRAETLASSAEKENSYLNSRKVKQAEKDEISLDTLSDKQKPSLSRSTPTAEKKAPEKSGPKTGL